MQHVWAYDYPVGTIGIAEEDGFITHIFLEGGKRQEGFEAAETSIISEAGRQLGEYFSGKRTEFDLPLSLEGTEFQKSAWNALETIPYGETRSYKDIAVQIGNPKAVRAVGMANNRNPIPIIVPCHRVVGANGSLVGYGGGLPMKQHLLDLEKRHRT